MRAGDQDDVSRVELSSGCRYLASAWTSPCSGLDLDPVSKHAQASASLHDRHHFRCLLLDLRENNHTKNQTLEYTSPPLSILQRCDCTITPYHPLPSLGVAQHLPPSQACRGWSSNLDRRRDQYLIFCP